MASKKIRTSKFVFDDIWLLTFFSMFWFSTFWSFDVLIILKKLSTFWHFDVLIFDAMILSYPKLLCSWQVLIYSFYFFTSALISSIIITILFSLFILFFILSTKNAKNCYAKNGSWSLDQISLDLFSSSRVCYKFGTRLNAFFLSRMKVLLMNSFFCQ